MILYLRQTSILLHNMVRKFYSIEKIKEFDKFWNYLMENYKNMLVEHNNSTSKEMWKNVRNYIESECNSFQILDSFILDMFYYKNHPNLGIYYYKFLEDNNYNPTVHTTTKYLKLYHLKNDLITEIDKKHILNLYDKLMIQYTSFNTKMSNILVKSLCKIGQWKEAIKVIEKYEANDNNLLQEAYNELIAYLFDHKEDKLAYEYLINTMKKTVGPDEDICITYLKYCLKDKHTFIEKIEKIFTLWNKYGVKPTQNVISEYMTACIEHGCSVSQTTISNLRCTNCKQKISEINISDEDYKYLFEAIKKFFEPAMYYITLPEEIKEYIMFVEKNKPFDVIIDGLNIIYTIRNDDMIFKYKIIKFIKSCEKQNKKILIIGRKHTKNFFKSLHINIENCFFVNNWSHDDLFILYAAFLSGKDVIVVTKDLLRQYKFAIQNTELNIIFNKWQFLHQYYFDKYRGLRKLNSETQIDAFVQKQNNYWHIPYIIGNKCRKRHTSFNDWFCFNLHK
ncbi:mitochondrial ribonuclease P catalytic subunit [Apis laboriosa]|uniref:mitochondrial ribonuclease P catalytic subunit n=1 Tax=Apis laboriosa TaxID=183418 RepID=UPI001CC3D342|nr:mitochondrial ribonuclease P catalytic subunit [Apis laboriosa]